jgi:hypothetical protein
MNSIVYLHSLDLHGFGTSHFNPKKDKYPNFEEDPTTPIGLDNPRLNRWRKQQRENAYENYNRRNFLNDFINRVAQQDGELRPSKKAIVNQTFMNCLKKIHSLDVTTRRSIHANFMTADKQHILLEWERYHGYYEKYLRQIHPLLPSQVYHWVRRYLVNGLKDKYEFPARFTAADRYSGTPSELVHKYEVGQDHAILGAPLQKHIAVNVDMDCSWYPSDLSSPCEERPEEWFIKFSCQHNPTIKDIQTHLEDAKFAAKLTEWAQDCSYLDKADLDVEIAFLGMSREKFQAFKGPMFHTKCVFAKEQFLWHEYTDVFLYVWPTYRWKKHVGSENNEVCRLIAHNENTSHDLRCYINECLDTKERSVIVYPWILDGGLLG